MSWNKPSGAAQPTPKKKPSALRGVVAGAVVVVAVVAVFFAMSGKDEKPRAKVEKKPVAIKEVKPVAAPKLEPEKKVEVIEKPKEKYPGEKLVEVITNGANIIEVTVNAEGRRTKHVIEPPSPWHYSTDGVLATALLCAKGGSMPPWPNMGVGMDKEFRKSLKDPILVLETDDDKTAALKRIVSSAREEMKERLEAGEHFCDVMNDFRELTNENGKIRANAIRELNQIKASGDTEGARKYEVTMNAAFSQMGIEPIGGSDVANDTRPRRNRSATKAQAPTEESIKRNYESN